MITRGYATVDELVGDLGLPDASEHSRAETAIEAASRAIDEACGRVFYAEGTALAPVSRYFTAEWHDLLYVDDIQSVSTLKTDEDGDRTYETTWLTTDYDLEPYNASPKTRIRTSPNGTRAFPTIRRGVEIAGVWGYAAVPKDINQACRILARRLFRRADVPFGIVIGQQGQGAVRIPRVDPDVELLLQPFRRGAVGAV